MSDPNQELATKTIVRLVREGLLSEKESRKISEAIATGNLGQDDWRVAFENSMEKEKIS